MLMTVLPWCRQLAVCNDFYLEADEVKYQVHAEIFEKSGGAVNSPPAGPIDVEMRLRCQTAAFCLRNGGLKRQIGLDAPEFEGRL